MNRKAIIRSVLLAAAALVVAAGLPAPAFAVSTVAISSTGNGVFQVRGLGIEEAAALDIVAVYDTASLANPRVAEGPLIAGAMTAVNARVPGVVHLVIIRLTPVQGDGVIASMTFDRTGASSGKVLSLNAKLSNINGAPIPAIALINNPPEAPTADSGSPQSGEAGTAASGPSGPGTAGGQQTVTPVVIIAGEAGKTGEGGGEEKKQEAQTPPGPGREPETEQVATPEKTEGISGVREASFEKSLARKIYVQKGILDRFRDYRGDRSARALVSLFEQESYTGFRQEPSIALSDGRSLVKVTFTSVPGNKTAADVAVMGARLLSITQDPDNTNTWVVELRPEKSAYRASLAVLQKDMVVVYPLTVAPKVSLAKSGIMNEADLNRYFRERPAGPGGGGVNKTEKSAYIDDYIMTANYLAGGATGNRKRN